MVFAQHFPRDLERLAAERLGPLAFTHHSNQLSQIVQRRGILDVVLAQHSLCDLQGSAIKPLGLCVVTLGFVQNRELVQAAGGVDVILAPHSLLDLQGSVEQRLGLRVVSHIAVQSSQAFQARGDLGVSFPESHFASLQGLAQERLGRRVVTNGAVQSPKIIQAVGVDGVFFAQHLSEDLCRLAGWADSLGVFPFFEKRALEPMQAVCFLQPPDLFGFERGAEIEVGQSLPGVGDQPLLPVRLTLADREHLRAGFAGIRPDTAPLMQLGQKFKRADHLVVQLTPDMPSGGELLCCRRHGLVELAGVCQFHNLRPEPIALAELQSL